MTLCKLCRRSDSTRKVFRRRGYDIYLCSQCGLMFADLSGSQKGTITYDEHYFQGRGRPGYDNYGAMENAVRRNAVSKLEFISRLLSHEKNASRTLLDVGCALGFFLDEASNSFKVLGYDVSEYAARFAKESFRLTVYTQKDLSQLLLMTDYFDVITMWDTLDHFDDPFQWLGTIYPLLKREGFLIFSIPDKNSLFARLAGRFWYHVIPPDHKFYFSQKTIRYALEKAGYLLQDVSYPWRLFTLNYLFEMFQKGILRFEKTLRPPLPDSWVLPFNLFDGMQVVARKRGGAV